MATCPQQARVPSLRTCAVSQWQLQLRHRCPTQKIDAAVRFRLRNGFGGTPREGLRLQLQQCSRRRCRKTHRAQVQPQVIPMHPLQVVTDAGDRTVILFRPIAPFLAARGRSTRMPCRETGTCRTCSNEWCAGRVRTHLRSTGFLSVLGLRQVSPTIA